MDIAAVDEPHDRWHALPPVGGAQRRAPEGEIEGPNAEPIAVGEKRIADRDA